MTGPLRRALDDAKLPSVDELVFAIKQLLYEDRHIHVVREIDIRRVVEKGMRAAFLDLASRYGDEAEEIFTQAGILGDARVVPPGDVVRVQVLRDRGAMYATTGAMIRAWVTEMWPETRDDNDHGE